MSVPAPDHEVRLATRVADLPGVGQRRAERFARLGIATVSDLIRHLPKRYEQQFAESTIDDLPHEGIGSTRGTIVSTRSVPAGRPGAKGRFQATLQDHRDRLTLIWFNALYLRNQIHPGMTIRVQGKVKPYGGFAQMVNPTWQVLEESDVEPATHDRLRPYYPATQDLSSAVIESVIAATLPLVTNQLTDPLAESYVRDRSMPVLADAFGRAHKPRDLDEAASGRRRLVYNELLLLQLGVAIKRHYNRHHLTAPALHWSGAIDRHIRDRFEFELTDAQNRVIKEIAADLQREQPMNRLLQGDVGAGKTVVALYALLMAVADRKQAALMAPTELLAEQHYMSIGAMLEGSSVRMALLTSGASTSGSDQRRAVLSRIRDGQVELVIGTQALLGETVRFKDLAVVVVDEQHRFGVLQRAAFRSASAGRATSPHYLVMTATPIPRTLSLTIFGDLDVSTIDKLPPGRTPIITRMVSAAKTDEVYDYMAKRVAAGEQAYVVVPAIDESGHESQAQLKNVRAHAKLLQQKLPDFKVAAMHGQMKRQTRESIMYRFRRGVIHVLVATTVIEVGVDVPNATMMVVEHAERFGLAQLHQLRGRIGRGSKQSLCVFITDPNTPDAQQRLEAIGATTDGFVIAERDLEIRGMGDFFGTRQHGLPPLRIADIRRDMDMLQLTRRDAEAIIEKDPRLTDESNLLLRKILKRAYGDAIRLIDVG